MTRLSAGDRVGPYEVASLLGAGGMGEVYRATDTRLGRDIALKILPSSFATDEERLRRLALEARAAGSLDHPNLLVLHDVGVHDGSPYLVSELLAGASLRAVLDRGELSPRKAVDYGIQISRGLAAAHEKGVIHRDLKPDNVFVTRDGRAKILDFGLAKLARPGEGETLGPAAATVSSPTGPEAVFGTAGYMSPEQVRGRAADHRSDIFALGALLYEMMAGRRAFAGASAVETMSAILKEDPPSLSSTGRPFAAGLERVVRRCLEKDPAERFRSAYDVALALEAVAGAGGEGSDAPRERRNRVVRGAATVVLGALAVAAIFALARRDPDGRTGLPTFRQITFRRGSVVSARFAPDGQTVLYSAAWEAKPPQVFSARVGGPESRPLGLPAGALLAISPSGEIALSLGAAAGSGRDRWAGTLARVPLSGGAPREITDRVKWADWAGDGRQLAVVRETDEGDAIEFPPGTVVYRSPGNVTHVRAAPNGYGLAFIEFPAPGGAAGRIALVERNEQKRVLVDDLTWPLGLAWAKSGREVLYASSDGSGTCSVRAATTTGSTRLLHRAGGYLTLHDVSPDGRLLVTQDDWRVEAAAMPPGEAREQEISWLDVSNVRGMSSDGRAVLLADLGVSAGPGGTAYLRRMDGSDAVRLGEGNVGALSPDGRWACRVEDRPPRLVLLPTGVGEPQPIPNPRDMRYITVAWFPDGQRLLVSAALPGRPARCHVLQPTGETRPVTPEGTLCPGEAVSPDGRAIFAIGPGPQVALYPLEGGPSRPVGGLAVGEVPRRWASDGRSLYVWNPSAIPAPVYTLDLATGKRRLWREIAPRDPIGITGISAVAITADGRGYAYSYLRYLSSLFLVEGLE